MPNYSFKVRDEKGQPKKVTIYSPSIYEAENELKIKFGESAIEEVNRINEDFSIPMMRKINKKSKY